MLGQFVLYKHGCSERAATYWSLKTRRNQKQFKKRWSSGWQAIIEQCRQRLFKWSWVLSQSTCWQWKAFLIYMEARGGGKLFKNGTWKTTQEECVWMTTLIPNITAWIESKHGEVGNFLIQLVTDISKNTFVEWV